MVPTAGQGSSPVDPPAELKSFPLASRQPRCCCYQAQGLRADTLRYLSHPMAENWTGGGSVLRDAASRESGCGRKD